MVLDRHRASLDWWLVPLARAFRHVNPNVFTWLSLIAAFAGGYAFYRSGPEAIGWLWLGWSMVLLNSILDLLDGKVARITGKQTAKGDYLDHAIDRFSDTLFLAGLTLSPWVAVEIGMMAIIFTLLTSYLGTQAAAVGMTRNYGGLLGRADRMVLLLLIPGLQAYLSMTGPDSFVLPGTEWETNALETMLAYFALVGLLTTVQRFAGGLRGFDDQGAVK